MLVTYEITCEKGLDADRSTLTKSFLTYTASDDGQAALTELGYVPITGDLLTKVRTAVVVDRPDATVSRGGGTLSCHPWSVPQTRQVVSR